MKTKMRRTLELRLAFGALIVMLAVALTGCQGSPGEPAPSSGSALREPALGPVTTVSDDDAVTRPIDAYLASPAVTLQLVDAQRSDVLSCLSKKIVVPESAWPEDRTQLQGFISGQAVDAVARSPLWGFFGTSTYQQYGYGRPPLQVGAFSTGIPAGVSDAAFDKCSNASVRAFPVGNGNGPIFSGSVRSLPDGGPLVPTGDTRYKAVVEKWALCMKGEGFDYTDPLSAMLDPKWNQSGSSNEQNSTARADVKCKLQTNLVGVALAIQAAYDKVYIDSHQAALAEYTDKINGYLRSHANG